MNFQGFLKFPQLLLSDYYGHKMSPGYKFHPAKQKLLKINTNPIFESSLFPRGSQLEP